MYTDIINSCEPREPLWSQIKHRLENSLPAQINRKVFSPTMPYVKQILKATGHGYLLTDRIFMIWKKRPLENEPIAIKTTKDVLKNLTVGKALKISKGLSIYSCISIPISMVAIGHEVLTSKKVAKVDTGLQITENIGDFCTGVVDVVLTMETLKIIAKVGEWTGPVNIIGTALSLAGLVLTAKHLATNVKFQKQLKTSVPGKTVTTEQVSNYMNQLNKMSEKSIGKALDCDGAKVKDVMNAVNEKAKKVFEEKNQQEVDTIVNRSIKLLRKRAKTIMIGKVWSIAAAVVSLATAILMTFVAPFVLAGFAILMTVALSRIAKLAVSYYQKQKFEKKLDAIQKQVNTHLIS